MQKYVIISHKTKGMRYFLSLFQKKEVISMNKTGRFYSDAEYQKDWTRLECLDELLDEKRLHGDPAGFTLWQHLRLLKKILKKQERHHIWCHEVQLRILQGKA